MCMACNLENLGINSEGNGRLGEQKVFIVARSQEFRGYASSTCEKGRLRGVFRCFQVVPTFCSLLRRLFCQGVSSREWTETYIE